MNLDLAGTIYTVSEKVNDIPGRLQLELAPGVYAFTANIPGTGIASRTVEVVAGKVTALHFVGAELTQTLKVFETFRVFTHCKN